VPTSNEISAELVSATVEADVFDNFLKVVNSGYVASSGFSTLSSFYYLWTSDVSGTQALLFRISTGFIGINALQRAQGSTVRCIQD
jgi:hypothetical protein